MKFQYLVEQLLNEKNDKIQDLSVLKSIQISNEIYKELLENTQIKEITEYIAKNIANISILVFPSTLTFRLGNSSIKNIAGFSSIKLSSTNLESLIKTCLDISKNGLSKTSKKDILCACILIYNKLNPDLIKSVVDTTTQAEDGQTIKTSGDLKVLTQKHGTIKIKMGKELYEIDGFSQVAGVPKADMVFTLENKEVIYVSHKLGKFAGNFQQYGGITRDLQFKNRHSKLKGTKEITDFLNTVENIALQCGASIDKKHGFVDFSSKTMEKKEANNFAMKLDKDKERVFNLCAYGKDFDTGNFGKNNCQILIDGDIEFKHIEENIYELAGSYSTHFNPTINGIKKHNLEKLYTPYIVITQSKSQGLTQGGFAGARVYVWPGNKIATNYADNFEKVKKRLKIK